MTDQLMLFDQAPTEYTDAHALYEDLIKPRFLQIVDEMWALPELLEFYHSKSVADKSAPDSIHFGSAVLLKIALKKKEKFISFPEEYTQFVAPSIELKKVKSDLGFVRAVISDPAAFDGILPALEAALKDAIMNYPTDWDCCSHYLECCDEKQCIHKGEPLFMGCRYKKRLLKGEIFYGKNKTIK